jgi:hypothetical protein
MRHLVQNFTKKFKGKVFTDNLWPASYTCSSRKHLFHLDVLYKQKPGVKEYLDEIMVGCGQEANSMKFAR